MIYLCHCLLQQLGRGFKSIITMQGKNKRTHRLLCVFKSINVLIYMTKLKHLIVFAVSSITTICCLKAIPDLCKSRLGSWRRTWVPWDLRVTCKPMTLSHLWLMHSKVRLKMVLKHASYWKLGWAISNDSQPILISELVNHPVSQSSCLNLLPWVRAGSFTGRGSSLSDTHVATSVDEQPETC